jgi:hypothetical protein
MEFSETVDPQEIPLPSGALFEIIILSINEKLKD